MRRAAAIAVGIGAELLLVLLLVLAPLPNGCLLEGPGDAQWQTLMDAALFLILMLVILEVVLLRRPFRTPRVWLPLALLLGFLLLQILPLPMAVVRLIAPATAGWVDLAAPDGPAYATLSLVPQLTLLEGLRLAAYLAALFVVVNRFRTMRDCMRLAIWLTLVGSAMAVLAFVHQATAPRFTLLWTWELTRWGAPFGSYINKNHFAGLMEICLAASLAVLLRGARTLLEGTEDLGMGARVSLLLGHGAGRVILPFVAFALMLAGLMASKSRAGWAAMAVSLLMLLLWAAIAKRSRSAWKLGVLIVLVVAGLAMFIGVERFENRFKVQARSVNRLRIWEDSARMGWEDYRYLGAGAGTFLYSFQPYHRIPDKRIATHAESDWLQTFTGVGLLGIALLAWAGIRFSRAIRVGLEDDLTPDRVFLAAAATGVLSLFLHGFFDVNLQIPANGMYFAVLAGLCLATARQQGGRGVLHWIDGGAPGLSTSMPRQEGDER